MLLHGWLVVVVSFAYCDMAKWCCTQTSNQFLINNGGCPSKQKHAGHKSPHQKHGNKHRTPQHCAAVEAFGANSTRIPTAVACVGCRALV